MKYKTELIRAWGHPGIDGHVRTHTWYVGDWPTGHCPLHVRQSGRDAGMVYVEADDGLYRYTWLAVPSWLYAALGDPASDLSGPLDYLVENFPDLDWLAAAVVRIATAEAAPV